MDSFKLMRRRTSDLLQNAQQNISPKLPQLPQMPQMPQIPSFNTARQEGMNGTWEKISLPSLPRSSHTLNVVSGSAYIFGGEISPREPVDNDTHIITLPDLTGNGDYVCVKAVADTREQHDPADERSQEQAEWQEKLRNEMQEKGLDEVPLEEATEDTPSKSDKGKGKERALDSPAPHQRDATVPAPRVGHASAVIGSRIFLYGGRGGPEMKALEEGGRVWVFDTRSRTWTFLDPIPAVKGGAIVPSPSARSYHCATAVDLPQDFAKPKPKKPEGWREWAVGDTTKTGTPQAPIVGNVAEEAVDQEAEGYGTFIVHGGCLANGERTNDMWAFDVRSRMWSELPAAPGPGRGGTAICVSKSRLFRFGGFDGQDELGGQLDFLQLQVEMFDDKYSRGEVAIRARGGWQSVLEGNSDASSNEIPLVPSQEWPAPRSVSLFAPLHLGGGREYLVLAMGEAQPSSQGHAGAGRFHGDVWTFQPPPQGMSRASLTDAVLQAVGRKTSEGRWEKVNVRPHDDDKTDDMPVPRGWLAGAPMGELDESGLVMWGGLGENNERLGDGWILRLLGGSS